MQQSSGFSTLTKDTKQISDWVVLSQRPPENFDEYDKVLPTVKAAYNDPTFKPVDTSISKNPQGYKKALNSVWKRPDDIFKGKFFLFQEGITADDINQGSLSDCYFLSTLSSLAFVNSAQIRRLFAGPKVNKFGIYGVWLCHDGEWRQVIVDDWFPVNKNGNPQFSKANGNELWVLLLEKAFAKTYGTYDKIEIGFGQAAHRDLTGAPAVYYNVKDNSPAEAERLFKICERALASQYVLTATSQPNHNQGLESENDSGVISSHCYSILAAARVTDKDDEKCNFLSDQFQKPWGKKEWTGDWGDTSDKWTPELKQQLNVKVGDDGFFWMAMTDIVKEYSCITVGYIFPEYVYSSFNFGEIPLKETNTIRLAKIVNKTPKNHVFVTVSQTDKRSYQKEKNVEYNYSLIKVCVFQYDPSTQKPIKFVEASGSADRDVFVDCDLDEGEYSVYVEVAWDQKVNRKLVLSTFSEKPVEIQDLEVPHDKGGQFLEEQVRVHSTTGSKLKVQDYKNDIKRIQGTFGGIIYFYYSNPNANFSFTEEFQMKNVKNLAVYPPRTQVENNTVVVKPQSNSSLIFKVAKNGGFGYSFTTSYSMQSC